MREVCLSQRQQATPTLIQKSFQHALILAGRPTFNRGIVRQLLSHGAKPADVFLAGLFELAGGPSGRAQGARVRVRPHQDDAAMAGFVV